MGPDLHRIAVPARHRAGGADGGMRQVGPGEAAAQRPRRRRRRVGAARHGAALAARRRLRAANRPAAPAPAGFPSRSHSARAARRAAAASASHSVEARTARKLPSRTSRASPGSGPSRSAASVAAARRRPHHPRMQHPRQPQVVHVARRAEDLVRQVDARHRGAGDAPRPRRLGRHRDGRLALQQRLVGQRPIAADLPGRAEEAAVLDAHRLQRHADPLRHDAEEDHPRLGAGMAQRDAAVLDREAAGGHPLVRAVRRRGRRRRDAGETHVQLVRRDLAERGQDPLAELHLARGDGDAAIGRESQPSRQAAVRRGGCPAVRGLPSSPSGRKPKPRLTLSRRPGSARMIRLWLPQRQRCGSSAARIGVLVGRAVALQQRRRADEDAREAIAALPRLLRQEGGLQRMRRLGRAQPLHRHRPPGRRRHRPPSAQA